MTVLITILIISLIYLFYEKISLEKVRYSVPLCIAVTGTRGKSGVVRQIASVMREDGRKVLAKTTGTEPVYILPNGKQEKIKRRGLTSIIEQKAFLKKAAALQVDCIVAEVMSIHPENHFVESQQILKPDMVVVSNVRADHTEAMGSSRDEIAEVFCRDIPEGAKVFIPENESIKVFEDDVKLKNGELRTVSPNCSSTVYRDSDYKLEFSENLDLVYAAAKELNISDKIIAAGINNAGSDPGRIRILKYTDQKTGKNVYLVNAFSANDPDSTNRILAKVRELIPGSADKITGILVLRTDRGDRTIQWINALKNGFSDSFKLIYTIGGHSHAVRKKTGITGIIRNDDPETVTEEVITNLEDNGVVFGFGNMVGVGRKLTDYWLKTGNEYGI